MLIMSRKPGEAVTIGDRIVVKIMAVEGGRVQLGIDAPKDVKIAPVTPAEGPQAQKK